LKFLKNNTLSEPIKTSHNQKGRHENEMTGLSSITSGLANTKRAEHLGSRETSPQEMQLRSMRINPSPVDPEIAMASIRIPKLNYLQSWRAWV
jgi:hypothetical protein